MRVFYICGYWSINSDKALGPRPDFYKQAYRYVYAVKSGEYRKPFYVPSLIDKRRFVRPENFTLVRRRFGIFVEQCVRQSGWEDALLIPVPSKTAIVGAEAPRSLTMVTEAMAATGLSGSVCDALRWTTKLASSHAKGERRRHELAPHLTVTQDVSGQDVVLIDDLLTRGGNMLASKDVLEAAGAHVLGAVTCGRTMYERSIRAFGRQHIDLTNELDDFGKAIG